MGTVGPQQNSMQDEDRRLCFLLRNREKRKASGSMRAQEDNGEGCKKNKIIINRYKARSFARKGPNTLEP